jgi:hypothetical protein
MIGRVARVLLASFAVLVLILGVGGGLLALRLLADPPDVGARPHPDPGGGLRVQEGFTEILMRQGGLSRRTEPVVITAADLNEFLARHLALGRLPVVGVQVRVRHERVEVIGQTSLGRLLGGRDASALVSLLPGPILDTRLWVVLHGRIEVRNGRGELVLEGSSVGRQPVPPSWLWRALGVRPADVLTWRLPRIVDRITLEPDRVLVHTRPRTP